MEDDEIDMLDLAFEVTETSRLGCQIKVREDFAGIKVRHSGCCCAWIWCNCLSHACDALLKAPDPERRLLILLHDPLLLRTVNAEVFLSGQEVNELSRTAVVITFLSRCPSGLVVLRLNVFPG